MTPTLIGVVAAIIGLLLLLRGSVPAMFAYMNILSLMGGSAVLILTSLGGSSIPPVELALGFAALRLMLPGSGQVAAFGSAVRANLLLVLFAFFGVVMAFLGPRMFAYQIQIAPMKMDAGDSLFQTLPLVPTSQNITTAVYLLGTLMAALIATATMRDERAPLSFVKTGVWIGWIHAATGAFGAVVRGKPLSDIIDFFRNGNYAQTDQFYGSWARINGIMPEPSTYAFFAFAWMVFMTECWWRDVLPRRTGPTAFVLLLMLAGSTSATAYAGIAAYALVLLLRAVFVPGGLLFRKGFALVAMVVGLIGLVAALLIFRPELVEVVQFMMTDVTVNKQVSISGMQRSFWAHLGLEAFVKSGGLGIGPGSFRSSSIVTAIIGSTGVIGSALFLVYLLQVMRPLRRSTYFQPEDTRQAVGVACSWAAIVMLIPAAFISATPDPGVTFAVFAGSAIALRMRPRRQRLRPVPA